MRGFAKYNIRQWLISDYGGNAILPVILIGLSIMAGAASSIRLNWRVLRRL